MVETDDDDDAETQEQHLPVSRPSQYSFHASLASHLVALLLSHYRLMMILIGDLNNGDHHRHVDDDHDDDDDDDDDDVGRVVSYNLRSIISHLKPTTVITIHQLIFSLDFDDHDGNLIFSFDLEDDDLRMDVAQSGVISGLGVLGWISPPGGVGY